MRTKAFFHTLAVVFLAIPGGSLRGEDLGSTLEALRRYESGADASALRQCERWAAQAIDDGVRRRELEVGLVSVIADEATFEGKRFACQQLAVLGTAASVPALAQLLTSEETVGIACVALASNPASEATDALRQALGTTQGRSRAQVVHALGVRRDARSVTAIAGMTWDRDAAVVEAAIVALGQIGTPAAAKALAQLRAEARLPHQAAVAEATLHVAGQRAVAGDRNEACALYEELLRVPPQAEPATSRDSSASASGHPLYVRRAALNALIRLDKDGGESRIRGVLRGADADLKPVAIAAVAESPLPDASVKFARLLAGLEPGEQVLLVEALADRADARALRLVRDLLNSPAAEVRLAAVNAEGQLGDADSVPVLGRMLARATPAETPAIVHALVRLKGGEKVDRALAMQVDNRMAGPKAPFLVALGRRGGRQAARLGLIQATSADPAMARAAFQAVARAGTAEDLPAMLDALANMKAEEARPEATAAVARVISGISTNETAARSEPVAKALAKATVSSSRISLIGLLPVAGGQPAFEALRGILKEGQPETREAAVRALADWPDLTAWDLLVEQQARAGTPALRAVTLRGLTRLVAEENGRSDGAQPARYRQLFRDLRSDEERKLVLGALSGAASPEALTIALEQVGQPTVKAEAAAAVRRIAEAIKEQHPEAAQQALEKLK